MQRPRFSALEAVSPDRFLERGHMTDRAASWTRKRQLHIALPAPANLRQTDHGDVIAAWTVA